MLILRRIQRNRALFILAAILLFCVVSLGTGFRGAAVFKGVRVGMSVALYPFQKVLRAAEDTWTYTRDVVISHHDTEKELEVLRLRLAEATVDAGLLRELQTENRRLRQMLNFQRNERRFALLPAKVIGRFEGTVVIDVGEMHGVVPQLCAVTPDGVVGVVVKVLPLQSYVYTLHNAECRVGAMIARNRAMGMLHGSGSDFSHICRLEYIDVKDEVQIGDYVVTSGGPVFPPNIPLGRVTALIGGDALLRGAYVEPHVNLYNLEELFLIKQFQRSATEMTGQNLLPDPEDAGVGTSLPDMRTLQEQLAP